ncbi:response regulator [Methanoregula sp.]|uniref:response regulator n=1 Tax=Methanoregula sp. TaxID=2052170 RepID=UPI00356B30BB
MTKPARILIVDDDESMNKTMALVLKRKGYDVAVSLSGLDAIGKVRAQPFDIIFMDIKMPVMDGVETFEKIREIRPDAVVMMMTAYSVEDLIQKALREGAYGIIYKPLDIEKTLAAIEEVKRKNEGMLIMVVDDDSGTTSSLRVILENKGHRIGIASTGEQALKMAQEKLHDIIFIDMKLPTINGLQTYLALKKIHPGVIAVMITAYRNEMASLTDAAMKESAYSVLYKPFDMESLLKIVNDIEQRKHNTPAEPDAP